MFPDLSRYLVIATILVTFIPLPLWGYELKLIPSLTLKEEFNDNIFLASTSRRSDYIATLTPSLDISSTGERRNVSLSTGINWLNYARNVGLDSVDYFAQSGFNYQYSPRLSISAGAGYVRNSRPDRIGQNDLTLKSGSNRQNYQLSGSYAVTVKSNSTVSYSYSQEVFDNPGVVTTRVHAVSIGQDYDLDRYVRQARLVGNVGYSLNLTNTSLVDNYTISVGFTKRIHELWNVSMNAGGRYTHSEFDYKTLISTVQTVASDDQGWIGSLSINYKGEKTNGSLAFNHDVTAASGRSGTTERTGISSNLSERFTRKLSGLLGLGYSWNRSNQVQSSAQSIDEKYLNLSGGLRYDFSKYLFLEGNYRFNAIYYGKPPSQANQNVFMLQLTMRRDVMDL